MKKTWVVRIVIFLLIGNAFFLAYWRKKSTVSLEHTKPYNAVVDERIDRLLDVLRTQSLAESLKMLDRTEHYLWPGAKVGAGTSLLMNDEGRYQKSSILQNRILSSRVFRKCLQEIRLLPPKEAARLIEDEINEVLPIYLNAYNDFTESRAYIIPYSDTKDGKPVISGLRYKLLALLLIVGTCELTDTHEIVRKAVTVAFDQKEKLSQLSDPHLQFIYMTEVSLCNPVVLSAGLYGTFPQKNRPEISVYGKRYVTHSLVDYTAQRTEFDDSVGMEIVPDKDFIKIRYFESATDEDVLALLAMD